MNCEKCQGEIVIAPNLRGKVVTFHKIPSMIEGFYTHTEVSCA